MRGTSARYNAFVSYSHQADGALASRLRSGLQGFARRWNQVRALRVFVDEASLSANPALWPAIVRALDGSQFLLLLASPEAAASRYVAKEIDHWRSTKPEGSILIALTDGAIAWDDTTNDFDWSATTALPEALRGAYTTEPRWVDLVWTRGQDDTFSLRDTRFRDAVADLAATLHQRDKDELAGEDVRRHRQATLLARGAALALTVLTVATAIAAVLFLRERNTAREQARVALSRQFAAQSRLAQDGRVDSALVLGVAALNVTHSAEARSALLGALEREPRLETMLWSEAKVTSNAVYVPPAGRLVAAGNERGEVTVWDRRTRRPVRTLRGADGPLLEIAMSADGTRLAGTGEHSVFVWDLDDDAATVKTLPSEETIALAYARDGRLAVASLDDSIVVWDAGLTRSRRLAPARGGGHVADMVFDAAGRRLLTVGHNGTAQIWDSRRKRPPTRLRHAPLGEGYLPVAWHGDEAVAGRSEGPLTRWNVRRPKQTRTVDAGRRAFVSVAFSPDGRVIAGVDGASIVMIDARDGRITDRFGDSGFEQSVAFSPDGRELATSTAAGAVAIWSATATPPLARALPVPHGVDVLAFDRTGTRLAGGTSRGRIVVWDARTGSRTAVSAPADAVAGVAALAFDATGTRLVAASRAGLVRLLDSRTGAERWRWNTRADGIGGVAIDAGGRVLAAGGVGQLWTWPAAGGKPQRTRIVPYSEGAALSADGTLSAYAIENGGIALREVDGSGDRKHTLRGTYVRQMALTSDLLAVLDENDVVVYDTRSGTRRAGPFEAIADPDEAPVSVAIAADGGALAAADTGGAVKLWDTAGPLGSTLDFAPYPAFALAFSDDGGRLAIATGTTVALMTLDEEEWRARACAIANRGLTDAERRGLDGVGAVRDPDPCR